MKIEDRPTDMLLRQIKANRDAVRYRNPETGRRHYCHEKQYRTAFLREILAMRKEIQSRWMRGVLNWPHL